MYYESALTRGTCAAVYCAVVSRKRVLPSSSGTPDASRPGTGRWVLIADDDADHRVLLSNVIRRAGFEVREACDGEEVLELIATHDRPACVVTDLMMPRLSGFGVLEQLHQNDPGLPIVLISAVGDDAMRTLALDLGAAAMLHKPFDFSALRELVVRVAERPTLPH